MKTYDKLISGRLDGTTKLQLSCDLEEFPREILSLADTLEVLDLSCNRLSKLPDDFVSLKKLRILFLSNNLFEEIPEVLKGCSALTMVGFKSNQIAKWDEDALPLGVKWLILTDNKIKRIPRAIGRLRKLQKLMLAGNQISKLPKDMSGCKSLELVRLSANSIENLPLWLFELPKLSWFGCAGNPCMETSVLDSSGLSQVHWDDIELKEELGSGASGVVSRAKILSDNSLVAIKVFKGRVTSDGYPDDEIIACMEAGIHPNLNTPNAKAIGHPEEREALIFPLIPTNYKNLGYPPSLITCTRDTYDEELFFSVEDIEKIASDIVSSASHLHSLGISHSDLYAHNILTSRYENNLLGDFGAATRYDKGLYGDSFERLEVRAFGCLLDDLLSKCVADTKEQKQKVTTLEQLKSECLSQTPATRPLFSDIGELLVSTREILT